MIRGALAALALAGCYTGSSTPPTLANTSPASSPRLSISARGLGPITETTAATLVELRGLFPDLVVKATNLGHGSGLVFEAFRGAEQLFYVVPDDVPLDEDTGEDDHSYATTIFAVFAISPKVAVEGRPWTIGAPLASARGASTCECWGDGEVTACFDRGARLRVIFEDRCEDARDRGGEAMIGKKVARVMWKVQGDDEIGDEGRD